MAKLMAHPPQHSFSLQDSPSIAMIDSGVGGLSVLLAIKNIAPYLDIYYLADAKYAPYGEKSQEFIINRGHDLIDWFYDKKKFPQNPKVVVVACNTLTVYGIADFRLKKPAIHFVGVEPGLKPASDLTKNNHIALLATRATLASQHMIEKIKNYENIPDKHFTILPIAGVGLVAEIEKYGLQSKKLQKLLDDYMDRVRDFEADILVLGCTHYSFLQPMIKKSLPNVMIIDTSIAVAEQVLHFISPPPTDISEQPQGQVRIFTTGDKKNMQKFIDGIFSFASTAVEKINL
ncbi:MAG: glutamate racemase [Alphaproteobacteria bacterium]